MHGQEIADELEKRKGERPSPGTIYPALKALKESGFIQDVAEESGKAINYTLTEEGKKAFKVAKMRFMKTFVDIL